MSDQAPDFLSLFRDEASERLDSMVDWLLVLERGGPAGEAIENIFREAHTIKGAAGMLGLSDVHDLAHVLEDVLSDVRDSGVFPEHLADPLIRSIDSLRRMIAGVSESPADLITELAAIRDASADPIPPETSPPVLETAIESQPKALFAPVAIKADEPAPSAPSSTAPRRAVHVAAQKIDRLLDLVGETTLHRSRLQFVLSGEADRRSELVDEIDAGNRLLDELKTTAIGLRTTPLSSVIGGFPRAVRDLALAEGKEVDLVLEGVDTELDRTIIESLPDSLTHLLRNAIAHGIEPPEERERAGKSRRGQIRLRAEQRGSEVEIVIADDGRGVEESVLSRLAEGVTLVELLAQRGYSTAEEVTELAGRGVGLDAVRARIEAFGGRLEMRSEPGRGTEVTVLLPLSLALLEVLLIARAGNIYGIPLFAVREVLAVSSRLLLEGRSAIDLRGVAIPLLDVADVVGASATALREQSPAAVVMLGERRVALACDELLGQEEIVVKPLGFLRSVPGYLGGTILGSGTIALLLDPLLELRSQRRSHEPAPEREVLRQAPKVLVVDDFLTARELQRSILEAAGYRAVTARDGAEALERLDAEGDVDLVVTDIEMPVMDGFALTEAIRASRANGGLPVIVVTTREGEDDRRRGLEAGADAYLTKRDFSQQTLLETVARLIGR